MMDGKVWREKIPLTWEKARDLFKYYNIAGADVEQDPEDPEGWSFIVYLSVPNKIMKVTYTRNPESEAPFTLSFLGNPERK